MSKKFRFGCLVGFLLLLSILVSSATTSYAAGNKEPIKIGALLSLSGPLGKAGRELKVACELAEEYINDRGGIKSLGGRPIKVVYGDTTSDADVARTETERLISEEKVIAMVDMYPSTFSIRATTVAERLKCPFIVAISCSKVITGRGYEYTFALDPSADSVAENQVKLINYLNKLSGKRKYQKVAYVYNNTEYGQGIREGLEEYLSENEYDTEWFPYPPALKDATTLLTKVKAINPDVIIQMAYFSTALLFSKAWHMLGIEAVSIDSAGRMHPAFLEAAGPKAEGVFILAQWNRDIGIPGAKELNDKYKERVGIVMTGQCAMLYQSILVIAEALERSGKADRDTLRATLADIEIKPGPNLILPYKSIKFADNGLIESRDWIFYQVQGGEFVTVWPEKYAGAKPRLPEW